MIIRKHMILQSSHLIYQKKIYLVPDKDLFLIPFETIKDKVMLDWRDDQRTTYNASLYILLKDKYTIKVKYSE